MIFFFLSNRKYMIISTYISDIPLSFSGSIIFFYDVMIYVWMLPPLCYSRKEHSNTWEREGAWPPPGATQLCPCLDFRVITS